MKADVLVVECKIDCFNRVRNRKFREFAEKFSDFVVYHNLPILAQEAIAQHVVRWSAIA
jgi:hypothetical protein